MAETPNQTRREIEETRVRITRAAEELEERINETRDWKRIISEHPLESVAIATAAGFILSSLLIPRVMRSLLTERRQAVASRGANILAWIRPLVTPIITARIVDYMRSKSGTQSS